VLAELPELLWLAHLGVCCTGCTTPAPTRSGPARLVARAVPMVDRLVRLSRLPLLRPVAHEVLDLAADLRGVSPPSIRPSG
jgi:hypothetical protein